MGHYRSEMYSELDDPEVWDNYKRKMRDEVLKTISGNPIKIKDITDKSKLKLYSKLNNKSKVIAYDGMNPHGIILDNLWTVNEKYDSYSRILIPISKFDVDIKNKRITFNKGNIFFEFSMDIKFFEIIK